MFLAFLWSWQEAIIIPVLKQGKDPQDLFNYRPIALAGCVCKALERMINDSLVWCLEKEKKILTNVQCGFRKRRSTLKHVVCLESAIRENFIRKYHCVGVLST